MERLSNRAVAYALIIMTVVLVLLDIGNVAKVDSSHFTVLATIVGILLGARHKTGDVRGMNTDTGTDTAEKEGTRKKEAEADSEGGKR